MAMDRAIERIVDESVPRLLARAANSRGLGADEIRPRVARAVEKLVLRADESAGGAEIRSFIDELRADDLCLILACERGDAEAWEELVASYDATVKSAARKISQNPEDAEDLAGSIWAELYGLKEGKSKLSYYSGRGSLGGWLRAVVSQLAVDNYRKISRFVQIEENREFENLAAESSERSENSQLVAHSDNPEEILIDKSAQRDVAESLREAVGDLASEDRLILKMYYFDDLKLKDIGAVLGFHEATASRKLVRIQNEIRKSVERILRKNRGWNDAEIERCLADAASRIGVGFDRMLAATVVVMVAQELIRLGVQQ
jgi:RNA polymerase sigma-70 factor (ECF subfamily)